MAAYGASPCPPTIAIEVGFSPNREEVQMATRPKTDNLRKFKTVCILDLIKKFHESHEE
jgi:hypothetical protein